MRIIKKSQFITSVEYSLDFRWGDCPSAGFGFPCDEHSNVDVASLAPAAQENYRDCVSGKKEGVSYAGVRKWEHTYREPAIGRCNCGNEVWLAGFTNTCDGCGADYNSAGQRLAPREQWGEETGESPADILRIP